MLNKTIKFFHDLRLLFLAVIIVALLYNFSLNPLDIGRYFGAQFGRAVGMAVSIPENPFNKLALQLKEKEDQLNEREKTLNERESELTKTVEEKYSTLFLGLSAGVAMLFILIVVNYYLDYRRRRREGKNK